jgi:hypothetical protein
MRPRFRTNLLLFGLAVVWLGVAGTGMWALHRHDTTAGAAAVAPTDWPAGSSLARDANHDTLIVFMHPRCPCSRATVDVLTELVARASAAHVRQNLSITVCMNQPADADESWDHTALWRQAAAVPGARLIADRDGAEARRFGAETSGQAMLYDPHGRLLFSGGLTESRGEAGESEGMDAILRSLGGSPAAAKAAPVYGCELFAGPAAAAAATAATRPAQVHQVPTELPR